MTTYRAAIIGTGRIASLLERDPLRIKPHTHAGWYAACPRTVLVAGCDTDLDRLHAFGDDWGLRPEALFTDYQAMLRDVRPDVVSICAYAPQRLEMIEAAVAAGIRGLWVEKAVACSMAEAEAIRELVREHDVAVVVDQPRRGDGRYLAVERTIREGTLGALESVHGLISGHLMHTGIHAWDVLRLWMGPWKAAASWLSGSEPAHTADMSRRGDPSDTPIAAPLGSVRARDGGAVRDQGGHVHIIFESGVHAFISGMLKEYFVFQFDLVFARGRVRLGNDVDEVATPAESPRYAGFLELAPQGRVLPVEAPKPMLFDLIDAIDERRAPWMSLDHAVEAFRLGIAVFQSQLEGHRFVTPDDVRPDLWVDSI